MELRPSRLYAAPGMQRPPLPLEYPRSLNGSSPEITGGPVFHQQDIRGTTAANRLCDLPFLRAVRFETRSSFLVKTVQSGPRCVHRGPPQGTSWLHPSCLVVC